MGQEEKEEGCRRKGRENSAVGGATQDYALTILSDGPLPKQCVAADPENPNCQVPAAAAAICLKHLRFRWLGHAV